MSRYSRYRAKLHEQNPYCCYCNRLTVLREGKQKLGRGQRNDDATIEHKGSRWDGIIEGRNRLANLTIACYDCNHKRGQEQEQEAVKRNGMLAHMPKNGRDKGSFPQNWFDAWERDFARFDCF